MTHVLSFDNVSLTRDGTNILRNFSWSVDSTQRWVVLGPNGAGKTSLMRIAAGQMFPSSGTVRVLDRTLGKTDLSELRNRIGFASSAQAQRIPASETVRDAVMTAAYAVEGRWTERYESIDEKRAMRVLSEWNLEAFAEHPFGTLSDGERKRTLIARAVMADPELLLLDEPASSLDVGAREQLLHLLQGFASSPFSPAMIMVTHHVEEIPPGFSHLLLVKNGEVFAAGALEDVLTSKNLTDCFGVELVVTRQNDRFTARMPAG